MTRPSIAQLSQAFLDLLVPAECGGCHVPGTAWCSRCAAQLALLAQPPGAGPVHAWGEFADPLRQVVTAWKDEGRRDLRSVLVDPLRTVLAMALADAPGVTGDVLVVPVPTSRRSLRVRGDWPLADLVRLALRSGATVPGARLHEAAALRLTRAVRDQAGLGRAARAENLRGAMTVIDRWRAPVAVLPCIVVDDVLTTGATLREATSALSRAGSPVVLGAVLARASSAT